MKLLIEKSEKNKQLVFNAIKKQILKHLEKLETEETANLQKAFSEFIAKGGKGYPVGTIREWKGKKFIKTAPGKWRPKYDGETRGAKLSVANLKKKIKACNTAQEMMQIVLENRDRFSDENGNPLPFVQDLSKFISQTQDEKFGAKIKEENTTKKKKTRSGGGDDGNGGDEPPDNSYPEKNYPEYKGKGQEAVDFIVKQKSGQVEGAFYRPEIGDIDVVWGKVTDKEKHKGYGLAHIIDKHGMDAVNKIGEVVKNGNIKKDEGSRIGIKHKDNILWIKRTWSGTKKLWIITSYKENGGNANGRSDTVYSEKSPSETPTNSISQNTEKSSKINKNMKNLQDKVALAKGTQVGNTVVFNSTPKLKQEIEHMKKFLSTSETRYNLNFFIVSKNCLWATDSKQLKCIKLDGLESLEEGGVTIEYKEDQIILKRKEDVTTHNIERSIKECSHTMELDSKKTLNIIKNLEKEKILVGKDNDKSKMELPIIIKNGKLYIEDQQIGTTDFNGNTHFGINYNMLKNQLTEDEHISLSFKQFEVHESDSYNAPVIGVEGVERIMRDTDYSKTITMCNPMTKIPRQLKKSLYSEMEKLQFTLKQLERKTMLETLNKNIDKLKNITV